jgi:alkanesulfonate monooxygenase SsuD/methylene tetrahydromethanopterin reductase-like flavin-dependent oxidoreductase (luciferase family)
MMTTSSAPPSFGYLLPTFDVPVDSEPLARLGARAEEVGFDVVWIPDSPLVYGLPDPLTIIATLATRTDRVGLATGLLLGGLREPVLLAHNLATLDRLAAGRLIVGLGSGFGSPPSERQFAAVGVEFATRVGRLAETIDAMRKLWAAPGRAVSYAGRHVAFEDVVLSPAPQTTGGPPIWLAGAGERAERRVGRLADGWLPYLRTAELYAEGWRRVQAGAADAGREAQPTPGLYLTASLDASAEKARARLERTIERWYGAPFAFVSELQAMYAGAPEGLRDWLDPYFDAGARHVVLRVADEEPRRGLEAAAAALPLLTDQIGANPEGDRSP